MKQMWSSFNRGFFTILLLWFLVGLEKNFGSKSFKFFNFCTDHKDFLNWVSVG